ncbi:MAG TPA: bifunctional UDP-N-acetylglucosamine diphosphorylase/glucosamine-1-phosphate N-acetyltransferase GlmU [Gammaproteobacteria bacterium]
MSLSIVILAAGKGTRMKSATPKVLHELAGKPLLGHVIDKAESLNPAKICVVYGHEGERLKQAFAGNSRLSWAEQSPQLGTGHAVQMAIDEIDGTDAVLVLYGDVPLTRRSTLERLLRNVSENSIGLLTAFVDDPHGYGRIIRNSSGEVIAIVEEKDTDSRQKAISEINTGIMALPGSRLRDWLSRIENRNSQGEYYLTDIVALAVADGYKVLPMQPDAVEETLGVNSRVQLAELERYLQRETAQRLMDAGVSIRDPQRFDARGDVQIGRDTVIDVDVVLEGNVRIGENVVIEPFCHLRDCEVGDGAHVRSHSVLEQCRVGENCVVGPFARLRPDTVLDSNARVGNFVEVKNAIIGAGSKVNHLSYVGDAEVGKDVNIGAGTITCNYDGANKHKTIIEDGAFIGSDTQLVAPVKVGKNATIGAGSTITKDTGEGGLTLSRVKQVYVENWKRPVKKK